MPENDLHEWVRADQTPQGHTVRWVLSGWPRSGWIYRLEPGIFLAVAITAGGAHRAKLNGGTSYYFKTLKMAKWWIERRVEGKPNAS